MKTKHTKYFLFILLLSPFLISQEFDEAFLSSLPESVQQDLLNNALKKNELEKPQYKRPSTFINKPVEDKTGRYGAKIFSMMQSTLMPINEPNFDGNYLLDFGDILEVQLVGQNSTIMKLAIKRDGSLNIPEIGKVFLAGLPLSEAADIIKNKIQISYIGVKAFITLVNVRDVQIIVAGNVYNPGSYTVNGNSNIFHALSVAGGPSSTGSYRKIDLIRDNDVIESIDLYQTFIFGKSSFQSRLRSGDLIFVRTVTNSVTISGAVRRPGIYELTDEEDLSFALIFANGLTNDSDLSDISLSSLDRGKIEKISINNISDLDNYPPRDKDKLHISKHSYRTILINGAIKNPGLYLVAEGDGILELVNKAGGYSANAYTFGGVLLNEATKKINQLARDQLYQTFLNNLLEASSANPNQEFGAVGEIMNELKAAEVSGRVSAEFDLDILKNNPLKDVILQNGDDVTIPEKLDHIYIFGEIYNEGTIRFNSQKDYKYYVNKQGGYKDSADTKNIFVLYPNGETKRIGRKNIFATKDSQVILYPGSVIFVPRKQNNGLFTTQTAQAYAAILGNIGVTLASLSVLKD